MNDFDKELRGIQEQYAAKDSQIQSERLARIMSAFVALREQFRKSSPTVSKHFRTCPFCGPAILALDLDKAQQCHHNGRLLKEAIGFFNP